MVSYVEMGMVGVKLSRLLFLLCSSSFIFTLSVSEQTVYSSFQFNGAEKPVLDVPSRLRGYVSKESHEEVIAGSRMEEITLTTSNVVLKTADWHAVNQLALTRRLLQVPPLASPPVAESPKPRTRVSTIIIAVVVSVVSTLVLALVAFYMYRRRMLQKIVAVREKPLLDDDSVPVSVDASAGNPKLKGNVNHHTASRLTPQDDVELASYGNKKQAHNGENFSFGSEDLFDINLPDSPRHSRSGLFRYPTMPVLTKDGRVIPANGSEGLGFNTAPTTSPHRLDALPHSSAAPPRQEPAADEAGAQSSGSNPTLASSATSFSQLREGFEELGGANAQKLKPSLHRRNSKFEEVSDPYPVGWKRNSMPKKPDAPIIKSSFVSAPTPGPPPLPAPPLVAALPEILLKRPDVAFPNLQDYIQQFQDVGGSGWTTPVSPSSPKTEGLSSVRPFNPGNPGDVIKPGSGVEEDENSYISPLFRPAAAERPEVLNNTESLTNGGDLSAESNPLTPRQATTPPPPPPPPPPPRSSPPPPPPPPLPGFGVKPPNGTSHNIPPPGTNRPAPPVLPPPVRKGPPPPPPPRAAPAPVRKGPPPPPPPRPAPAPPNLPAGVKDNRPPPLPISRPSNPSRTMPGDLPNQEPQKQLKPLHWDKVKTTPDKYVVWNTLNTSFQLDPQSLEAMFGIQKTSPPRERVKKASSSNRPDNVGVLDQRKAHNLGIQLRGLGLTRTEVCEALLEGDGLSVEILEFLVKAAPSEDEKMRFRKLNGEQVNLGPADRFICAILSVPNAWSRLEAMLYKTQYKEDLPILRESLEILKVACKDLKDSRTFRKLLEAVLKTGNRLNKGTYRGDAKAFKLESLLKLADVKGVDNRTTLLQFVIQEIKKSESANLARLAGMDANIFPLSPEALESPRTSNFSDVLESPRTSNFSATLEADMKSGNAQYVVEYGKMKMQMGKVTGLPVELATVSKAGSFDWQVLNQSVQNLVQGFQEIKAQVEEKRYAASGSYIDPTRDIFQQTMDNFIKDSAEDVTALQQELGDVTQAVKLINVYFNGTENASEPLEVFLIVKQFLIMLQKACKDVLRDNLQAAGSNKP